MPEANAAWRRSNIGFLLFAATDRFVCEKLALVHANGFAQLTDAQLTLLLNIDAGGTRPTTLAARTALTKPSVVELVDRGERNGLVERHPDRNDSRAKIVTFTPLGTHALAAIQRAVCDAEGQFASIAGADLTPRIKQALGAYAAELSPTGASADPQRNAEWHGGDIGRVLATAARRFVREVLTIVHDRGHRDIGEALLALVRNLDLSGNRLTELAARAHMTKQSMRELVDRGENLGLVLRAPDPDDKRAKTIRFTTAGVTMLEDMRSGVEVAEQRLALKLGKPLLSDIRNCLLAYIADGGEGRHMPFAETRAA